MSVFDVTSIERNGNTENDTRLETLENTTSSINELAERAMRSIDIFSNDLEPGLYDNEIFADRIRKLVRGNRHASVRILLIDPTHVNKYGHRLIRLAQQLTTAMEIRLPSEEYQELPMSFMLVDNSGFIFKPDCKANLAIYTPECKFRGNKLAEFFASAWEHATPAVDTRRMFI